MKQINKTIRNISLSIFAMLVFLSSISAAPVTRFATGANAAAIQATVDTFRADLGGTNNGVGGSFKTGRREINWDGVSDSFSAPNALPADFFNINSPRGAVFFAFPETSSTSQNSFRVSADASNPTNTPVRFGNVNASYPGIFQTFSAERLFVATDAHTIEITFFIPGTNIPATVSGFGAIFCDVDNVGGANGTRIRMIGVDGKQLFAISPQSTDNGLSFAGVSFNAGERVARVIIENGNADLTASNNDGVNGVDVVAMDDFIYGEPRASQFHANDYDGDGFADLSVFRPSANTFFVLNSGSNTADFIPFGANGDIPVQGDFDGDQRADVAIFRPSVGQWWFLKSSDGSNFATSFGMNGDKPVPADYDKDGKTDIAIWRPSTGIYFIARSSDNFTSFFTANWGLNGDLPVGAAIAP